MPSRSPQPLRCTLVAIVLTLMACTSPAPGPSPAPPPGPRPSTAAATPVVDVVDFGASGNGRTDDRPAIQAAMDHAAAVGADVVLPTGRFLLGSATVAGDRVLRTYPHQHLRGAGSGRTTLAVGTTVGAYVTVLGAEQDSTAIGSWSLSGLTVDQGASLGNGLDVRRMGRAPRMAVRLGDYGAGSTIRISDCVFADADNVNTLYLFGETLVVERNRFTGAGGPVGTPIHDHSSVYLTTTVADGTERVVDNTFAGVRGSGGARTAVETHGGRQDVSDNVVTDYLRGMNLTGVASVPATSVNVTGNQLHGVAIGLQLWADRVPGQAEPTGLEQVVVSDNEIVVDGAVWQHVTGSASPSSAILVNPDNAATIGRLRVADNDIWFRSLPRPLVDPRDKAAIACRAATATPLGELEVVGNRSAGAPVWLGPQCLVRAGSVRDNRVS